MNVKKRFAVVLAVMMIFTAIPAVSFGAALPFQDVPSGEWYYEDVKSAYETGLVNGMTATTFEPESNMTYAQAVKLAACMHQKYTAGSVTLENGSPDWWDSYVAYAKNHQIISKNYPWNSHATRAGYVEIFAHALPEEALGMKNTVPNGAVPDVPMAHPQAAEIYQLYRAGILTGTDKEGHFEPDNSIKRSEVSAILTRMMDKSARKSVNLKIEGPTYAVRFHSNGGSEVEMQVVPENGNAVRPADPSRDGYFFGGWYSDSALTKPYNFDSAVTKNLMLYAGWTEEAAGPAKYTVTFVSNGGSMIPAQKLADHQKATNPGAPARQGYTFGGWYRDSELTVAYDFAAEVTGDLTLYAKWSETTFTVTFDTGKGSAVEPIQVPAGQKLTKPMNPVREGYDFLYWCTDQEHLHPYSNDTRNVVNQDITLYAKWLEKNSGGSIQDSWEDIILYVRNGVYKERYRVGNAKTLYLGPEGRIGMIITAIDEDELADGSGKAPLTWTAGRSLKTKHRYNPNLEDPETYLEGYGTVGSWESSELRFWLQSYVMALIPAEVQDAIRPVTKYSAGYDSSGNRISDMKSTDDLWIPSYREVYQWHWGYSESETMGPDYSAVFSHNMDKTDHDVYHSSTWWLRSAGTPVKNLYASSYNTYGPYHSTKTDTELDVVFGFCM